MKTVILIPARHASSRFPERPLVGLRSPDEAKPLIRRNLGAARSVRGVASVHVVADDHHIRSVVAIFGASVLLTLVEAENGTARCAEALSRYGIDADLIVNFQGDASLTPPEFFEALAQAMAQDAALDMATAVIRCNSDRKACSVGGTTAFFGRDGRALYFSKEVIAFVGNGTLDPIPVFHHIGLYTYRPPALAAYVTWPIVQLESVEGFEQLWFLENGKVVHGVPVNPCGHFLWELNNPVDAERIETVLAQQGEPA